jgi:hypothetical protein
MLCTEAPDRESPARPQTKAVKPLRVALISTPRAGNNWLRYLLTRVYDIPGAAVHSPSEIDWETLPPECLLGIHWHPAPPFLERLDRHGFRPVVLARHPLDVLISILHFALHFSANDATQRWLEGEAGNERPIFAAMPRSAAFLEYATGKRARALLAVSHEWWQVPGCLRVRYEDLACDTAGELARLAQELDIPLRRPVAEALEATTLSKLRAFTGSKAHFWQGKSGLWRQLLTAPEAHAIGTAYASAFADFGYACDPDPELDGARADANWINLIWDELADDLARIRTHHLVVKNMRATEEKVAAAQAQRETDRAEVAETRRVHTELVGRFTAVQQQLLDVQVTYHDMVEKLAASQLALGDVQARHAVAREAADVAGAELRARQAECAALRNELLLARQAGQDLSAELAAARVQLAAVAGLGPRSLAVARAAHGAARRLRRLVSLVRQPRPANEPEA